MLAQLYRKTVPQSFREKIYSAFLSKILFFIRNFDAHFKGSIYLLFSWLLPKSEKAKAYAFIGKHGITSYPGEYSLKYKSVPIEVFIDANNNLPYVIHNQKKLYFPEKYSKEKVSINYRTLIIEQDIEASHRYVNSYDELKDRVLFDVGSAEGIFSLDTIHLVKHIYLFECEDYWIDALNATFEPWKEKVTIIKKYVGDKDDEQYITIDELMKEKSHDNLFLKMDIEGAEQSALHGAKNVLKNGKNIKLSVCIYHRDEDPKEISTFLQNLGYTTSFTQGYIYWGGRLSKAVIRCQN
jgi:Methyltransferase FkbM domain